MIQYQIGSCCIHNFFLSYLFMITLFLRYVNRNWAYISQPSTVIPNECEGSPYNLLSRGIEIPLRLLADRNDTCC